MVAVFTSSSRTIPRLIRRPARSEVERATQALGYAPIAARIVGRRVSTPGDIANVLAPTARALSPCDGLADLELAAMRLARAVVHSEQIGVQTDYDMDGLGAHASFVRLATEGWGVPATSIRSYIGHRLYDGYGLTDPLVDRILSDPPAVLITADNGSNDGARVARLAAAGVDVIVTDHHRYVPELEPTAAYAFVNPQRPDCEYPDKAIAGGMVMWLVLRRTQELLVAQGHPPAARCEIESVLDYVACSTIADCVSMASVNNRYVVGRGLQCLNAMHRPCWRELNKTLRYKKFTAESIGFGIAPHINARTRLADPYAALQLLLTDDEARAGELVAVLRAENDQRKSIEKAMLARLVPAAGESVAIGKRSIVEIHPEGHSGVQGICSSRLAELFGRPTFIFSPHVNEPDVLVGSARGLDGFNVHAALQHVQAQAERVMVRYGGHKAAAGATIRKECIEQFKELFEEAVCAQLAPRDLGPRVYSDGALSPQEHSLSTVRGLEALEPTGRGFECATFDGEYRCSQLKAMGDGTHLSMQLSNGHVRLRAVWFRARSNAGDAFPIHEGDSAHFVFSLVENEFRGRHSVEMRIQGICAE